MRIGVIDLLTGGNGPDDVCEVGWQDLHRSADGGWPLDDESGAVLVNPGRPMSPHTAAVLRPEGGVAALAAHRAAFDQRYCRPIMTGGAGWICTWKCALRLWPDLPRFSNQMLRYLRMSAGLVHEIGLPAHRAGPDAYVTANHLRDMLNEASVAQLLAWSQEPGLLPRVPAGPVRGRPWAEFSGAALLAFAGGRDLDVRFSAQCELRRRGGNIAEQAQGGSRQATLI